MSVRGGGLAVLFRYGVVVLFDTTEGQEKDFLASIGPSLSGAHPVPEVAFRSWYRRGTRQRSGQKQECEGSENHDLDRIVAKAPRT